MMDSIPALSIRQPWAELILLGKKTIELRTWATDYRGRLWLHTGLKGNDLLEKELDLSNLFKGGYVGVVNVSAVVPMDQQRWETWREKHLDSGNYRDGFYAWILSSPQRFVTPIRGPGQLNLFAPSPSIEAQLLESEFVK